MSCLDERLGSLRALTDVFVRAEALLVAVERTGYAPLRAEALAAVGFLGDHCSDVATTVPQLEAAFDAALAGRDDEQAARAAIVLPVQLDRLGRLPESRVWLGHARAVVQRLGARGGLLESWLRLAEATVAMSAGDSSAAIAAARDSVALKERLLAPDHPDRLEALATLGNALLLGGKVEEALDFDRRGVETCARIVGASHPLCALLHVNLGEALEASKRPSEARENYARALEVWRLAGADPSYVAWGLTGLGRTLVAEGRAAEAVAPLEEALEIRTATKAPPALLGETRFALAGALGTNARAVELAKAARVDLAKDARAVARIDAWLEGARSGRR
jgi:tetratricopeptide (TPR) repeat protein